MDPDGDPGGTLGATWGSEAASDMEGVNDSQGVNSEANISHRQHGNELAVTFNVDIQLARFN